MDLKKSIVFSRLLYKNSDYFEIFTELSQSFGYEPVAVESARQAAHYVTQLSDCVLFCDYEFFSEIKQELTGLKSGRDKPSLVILTTEKDKAVGYDMRIDACLPLSLALPVFGQVLYSVYKYVWITRHAGSVQPGTSSEFSKKLLSETAHAINNILTGMQGYAELAQLNPDDKKFIQDSFKVVLDSSYRVRHEIKNLRAFLRIETPNFEPVSLQEVIRESADLLKTQIKTKQIEFEQKINRDAEVKGDYDQLVQVLFNLMNDVVSNLKEKQSLSLTLTSHEGEACITCTGNGYVLDEKDFVSLQRVFAFNQPVLKMDSKEGKIENRNVLSICNRILYNHGGEIQVDRARNGEVLFSLKLPVQRITAATAEAERAESKQAYAHIDNLDMEILVVDDEEYVRNTIYYFFDKKGCRVTLAEDGEFGLSVAKEKPFDLIFMDYLMPKMGGVEAAKKILENNSEVKIVFITGRESLDEEALYKSGVCACIKKPFELSDLYDIARKVALQKGIVD